LVFLGAFLLLGKPLIWSFSLAVLAGVATGWIVTGWQSKELPAKPKNFPELPEFEHNKHANHKDSKFQKRKQNRYRRQPQKSWFFWKNPRRPPKKHR